MVPTTYLNWRELFNEELPLAAVCSEGVVHINVKCVTQTLTDDLYYS